MCAPNASLLLAGARPARQADALLPVHSAELRWSQFNVACHFDELRVAVARRDSKDRRPFEFEVDEEAQLHVQIVSLVSANVRRRDGHLFRSGVDWLTLADDIAVAVYEAAYETKTHRCPTHLASVAFAFRTSKPVGRWGRFTARGGAADAPTAVGEYCLPLHNGNRRLAFLRVLCGAICRRYCR